MANSAAIATCHVSGLGKGFMGSSYLWGHSIQEMSGNVVIGRSIYGVVVIDGLLYSQFYSMYVYMYNINIYVYL